MFRSLPDTLLYPRKRLSFTFEGLALTGHEGDSVSAALMANGVTVTRTTPVSGAARGPFCMIGVCFECLVVIDGIGNRQGCLVPLREGMTITRQLGARQLSEGE